MNTDSEIIEATLSGDRSAFGKLVSRYQMRSYQLACRIISNPLDASDITQEAFVKAYQNLWQLKDRDKFLHWFFQIVKNQCINWIHKHQRKPITVEDELVSDRLHLPSAPDAVLIEHELHKQIMEAISKLPIYERKAVEMFYLEDRSYSEIQDELGITKGTLGRLLHQARAKLRESLQKAYQGAVFSVGAGLKRILRLMPEPMGAATQTSILVVTKCLIISIMLHLAFLTGISVTGFFWGTANGTNGNAGQDLFARASLVKEGLPDPNNLPSYTHARLPSRYSMTKQDLSVGIAAERNVIHKSSLSNSELPRLWITQDISISDASSQIPELTESMFGYKPHPRVATHNLNAASPHTMTHLKPDQVYPFSNGEQFVDNSQPDIYKVTLDIAPVSAQESSDPLDGREALPDSYGPFYVYDEPVLNVRKVLRQVTAMARIRQYRARILQTETRRVTTGILERYDASTLQAMTKGSQLSTVLAAGCNLETLKVFVVSDMAPLVITRSPVGSKHIRAIVGYDDSTERLVLIDPINHAVARFSYSEFRNQWDDPRDACLLVLPPRNALLEMVRSCLDRYLPERKAESILIRVSEQRQYMR